MDIYDELIKTAQLLKMVSVTGDYWVIMQGCVNSVLKAAEYIKQKEAEKNDAISNGA